MAKPIFIDNCAFDALYELGIEPANIQSAGYEFWVTGEVLAEIDAIPDVDDKQAKKEWIKRVVTSEAVEERGYFGFAEAGESYGFDQGLLADLDQSHFLTETAGQLGPERATGFPKHHTDRLLLSHAICFAVITAEKRLGNALLSEKALERGATIISLQDFNPEVETFIEFLCRHY